MTGHAPEETFTKGYCSAAFRTLELNVDRLQEKLNRLYEQGADKFASGCMFGVGQLQSGEEALFFGRWLSAF